MGVLCCIGLASGDVNKHPPSIDEAPGPRGSPGTGKAPDEANLVNEGNRNGGNTKEDVQESMTDDDGGRVKRWQRGQLLGEGSFGRVWMALDEASGELQAVKEVPIELPDTPQAKHAARQLEEEVRVLQRIAHRNIVRYVGAQRDDGRFYVFLEYIAGGSVASLLAQFGPFRERVVRNYSRQLATGLEFLHSRGVLHRDIKGANCLVTTSGVVKLADFGASRRMDQLLSAASGFKSLRGTPHWMAPECVRQEGAKKPADVWSLACVMVEMATAKPPWPEVETQMAVLWHIAVSDQGPELPQSLPDEGKDLLRRCFRRRPGERPAASEMLSHPFLRAESSNSNCSSPARAEFFAQPGVARDGKSRFVSLTDVEVDARNIEADASTREEWLKQVQSEYVEECLRQHSEENPLPPTSEEHAFDESAKEGLPECE